MQFFLADFF